MSDQSFQFRLMRYFHQMDFESQKKAEKLYKSLIVLVAIVSYVVASVVGCFSVCVYSTLGAMVLSWLIVVPGQAPWWKHPLPPFRPNSQKKSKKA